MTNSYEHKIMTVPLSGWISESELKKIGKSGFHLVGSLELWQTNWEGGDLRITPNGTQLIFEKEKPNEDK